MTCVAPLHESLLTPAPTSECCMTNKILQACKKKKGLNNKKKFIFVPYVLGYYCEILKTFKMTEI